MLQLNNLDLIPDQKIVRAEEYQAYVDAQGIIATAQQQAAKIIVDAKEEYENQKKLGFEDGLMEGRMEMAEKMVDSVIKSVDFFSSLEEQVVDLVVKSLKKIVGEINADDRIISIVRNALAVARTQSKVIVRVCPTEVETVQERLAEIMKPYPAITFIDVVSDSRLATGGCILETDIGVVDASIDVQVLSIERSLSKSLSGEA